MPVASQHNTGGPGIGMTTSAADSQTPVTTRIWDKLGGLASATCATHCLAMAAVPSLLPALGLRALTNGWVEWLFVLTALGIAGIAAWRGYRTHRSQRVLTFFVVGAGLLMLGRLGEATHLFPGATVLSIAGGVTLFWAHISNTRHCRHCPPDREAVAETPQV